MSKITRSTPLSFMTAGDVEDMLRRIVAESVAPPQSADRIGGVEVALDACDHTYSRRQIYALASRAHNPLPSVKPAGKRLFSYNQCRAWFSTQFIQ